MYLQRLRTPLLLLLLLASAQSPPYLGWPWSVDAWIWQGMYELPQSQARLLLLAIGVLLVLADVVARTTGLPRLPSRAVRWLWRPGVLFGIALVTFWVLRVHRWEGDFSGYPGHTAVESPMFVRVVAEPAEPLGTISLAYLCRLADWFGVTHATAVQVESVLYGAFAIVGLALWAQCLPQPGKVFWMVALSGYMVLFCGYVEKGTIKALSLNIWYVYAGTRALTGGAPAWSSAASLLLATATLMHGSALSWLPAHALAIWTLPGWRARIESVLCWLLPIAVMVWLISAGVFPTLGGTFGNMLSFLSWTTDLCNKYWHAGICGDSFFGIEHAFWFLNSLLTFAPAATLCIPEAAWRSTASRRAASRLTVWLGLGACGWLFLSAVWHPGMGFGWTTDWDIFALPPFVLTVWAVTIASTQLGAADLRHFAAVWIAMTAPHTLIWWHTWRQVGG